MSNDLVIVQINRAQKYLEEAKTLLQVKEVIALADAAAVYARRMDAGIDVTNQAAEIRLRAERRFGEMLEHTPMAQGTRGKGRPKKIGDTNRVLPKNDIPTLSEVGVSLKESARAKDLASMPEKLFEESLKVEPNKELNHNRVVKKARETRQRKTRADKRVAASNQIELDDRIIVGDFREHADKIADGSIALIFTDPPYDREASKMLPELAEFAAKKLAEGGSLICYVGQTQIPDALDALRLHLRYWWTIACLHSPGSQTVMKEYGIMAGWKAVLWFVKGTRDDNSIFVSDVMSGGKEKDYHDWQQSQPEAEYWIDKLCPADGIVCDPFLGGGTTAAAAEKLSRQWIGFEIDETTAKIASARLAQ